MIPFNVLIFDEENGTHKTDKCWDNNNIVHCIILTRCSEIYVHKQENPPGEKSHSKKKSFHFISEKT